MSSAPRSCLPKSAVAALKAAASSAPPSKAGTVTAVAPVPMRTTAVAPAGAASFLYGTPARASAVFATSQDSRKAALPTGSNCRLQRAGSATTATGAVATARSSAGFA